MPDPVDPAPESAPEMSDLKAKMKAALDRKNQARHRSDAEGTAGVHEKAHGSEVVGGAPKMHRRKAGGGGS